MISGPRDLCLSPPCARAVFLSLPAGLLRERGDDLEFPWLGQVRIRKKFSQHLSQQQRVFSAPELRNRRKAFIIKITLASLLTAQAYRST